jgi:hypothetical protein
MNIINQEFKNLFNKAIDEILSVNALTLQCKLIFPNTNQQLCENCVFDVVSNRSSNIYNNTGPAPFADLTICPVCNGLGFISSGKEETINIAVIFDSKYWLNWKYNSVNITNGMIQTICHSSLLPKIRNAEKILVDTTMENYGSYYYERASDPELAGLGDNRYIFTMWKRL